MRLSGYGSFKKSLTLEREILEPIRLQSLQVNVKIARGQAGDAGTHIRSSFKF